MERRSFTGESADRNRPSALFAGVLNDYIISSVCSTLLFYGGFSVAVKQERKKEEERKKKYKSGHLVPNLRWRSVGKGGRSQAAALGVGPTLREWVGGAASPASLLGFLSHCLDACCDTALELLVLGLVTGMPPAPVWPRELAMWGCGPEPVPELPTPP